MPLFPILSRVPDHCGPIMRFMNQRGKIVIEPQFSANSLHSRQPFSDVGCAIVQRLDRSLHIVIDHTGKLVFEFPKDHQPTTFRLPDENGIFGITHKVDAGNPNLWERNGRDLFFHGETRCYAMRIDGSIVFEGYVTDAAHGHYVFSRTSRMSDKKGLMNHEGQVTIPPIYDAIILSRTDPYATVRKGGDANVFTLDGTPLFAQSFEIRDTLDLGFVENKFLVVPNYHKDCADVFSVEVAERIGRLPWSYGSPVFPRTCPSLSGGVICIRHPEKGSAYYYPDGTAAMPGLLGRPRWFKPEMRTGYFCEGRASFKLGEAWGYMDIKGKHVISPQYYSNLNFQGGLARVKYPSDGNSWDRFSYVDRMGDVVWHQES